MFEFLCCNCNRYEKYSQKKGWKFDVVDIMESDLKGYKVCLLSCIQSLVIFGNFENLHSCSCWIVTCVLFFDRKLVEQFQALVSMGNSNTKVAFIECRYFENIA